MVHTGSKIIITAALLGEVSPWAYVCKKKRPAVAKVTLKNNQPHTWFDTLVGQSSKINDNDKVTKPTANSWIALRAKIGTDRKSTRLNSITSASRMPSS